MKPPKHPMGTCRIWHSPQDTEGKVFQSPPPSEERRRGPSKKKKAIWKRKMAKDRDTVSKTRC